MLISELTIYDFFREKIKLSDNEARQYAKELALAEEKLRADIKVNINEEFGRGDYATKKDIKELEIKFSQVETKISQLETKIEKGFKDVIVWVVGTMVAIGGLSIAIIKLF